MALDPLTHHKIDDILLLELHDLYFWNFLLSEVHLIHFLVFTIIGLKSLPLVVILIIVHSV